MSLPPPPASENPRIAAFRQKRLARNRKALENRKKLRWNLVGLGILALVAIQVRGCMADNERFREVRARSDYCSQIIVSNGYTARPKGLPMEPLPKWCERKGPLPQRHMPETWVRFWE